MVRFEAPAARRLRRQAAHRTRWEIALLALAVGHWAYHKNREWDLLVKDLVASRARHFDVDDLVDPDAEDGWSPAPPHEIDLTSTDSTLEVPVAR